KRMCVRDVRIARLENKGPPEGGPEAWISCPAVARAPRRARHPVACAPPCRPSVRRSPPCCQARRPAASVGRPPCSTGSLPTAGALCLAGRSGPGSRPLSPALPGARPAARHLADSLAVRSGRLDAVHQATGLVAGQRLEVEQRLGDGVQVVDILANDLLRRDVA